MKFSRYMIQKMLSISVILLISLHVHGQNADSLVVNQTDSLVSLIPSTIIRNDFYETIEGSGRMYKRVFGLFKVQTGSFSSDIVFHDTIVFSVENVYRYRKGDEVCSETFYYSDNTLIKYVRELWVNSDPNPEGVLKHRVIAYFNHGQLIRLSEKIHDAYTFDASQQSRVVSVAKYEVVSHVQHLKED